DGAGPIPNVGASPLRISAEAANCEKKQRQATPHASHDSIARRAFAFIGDSPPVRPRPPAPARLPLAHGKPTPDCAAHFCDTDLPAAPPRTPPPPPPIAPAETAPYPDCCARPAARAATATLPQTLAVPHRDRADRAGDFPSACSSPDSMARAGAP